MTVWIDATQSQNDVWPKLDVLVNSIEQENSTSEVFLENGYRMVLEDSPTLTSWSALPAASTAWNDITP